jgi:hypothetical protein
MGIFIDVIVSVDVVEDFHFLSIEFVDRLDCRGEATDVLLDEFTHIF